MPNLRFTMAALCLVAGLFMISPAGAYSGSSSSSDDGGGGVDVGGDAESVSMDAVNQFRGSVGSCGGAGTNRNIECIADELDELANDLSTSSVNQTAPKAAPVVRSTARKVRQVARRGGSKATKRARVRRILRRAKSILRGLANRNSGSERRVYVNVAAAMSRAIHVARRI